MAAIRQSKYKHVYGKPLKRDEGYDCIRITKSSLDASFCSVNPKFLAIITEAAGGGSFLVLPISKTGRIDAASPSVAGHTAAVLDIEWCPHNDNLIASGSEDCTAKIWDIPEEGLAENLTTPVVNLVAHQRRVNLVRWHPTAELVLLTSGADCIVFLWQVATATKLVEISFPKVVHAVSFNYNGSKLVTSCRDGMTRTVNPRTGEILQAWQCHEGAKSQQCVYLKDDRIFTTGFSRMSERQYALWDTSDVSKPLCIEGIDTSNGVLFPFYDPDCSIIYLCGKGDSSITYFEYVPDESAIYYLSRFDSSSSQRGFGFMPKRGLNVKMNEIGRLYKLHNSNWCEVIPFIVPRKSELFQDDLYPNTAGDQPALTAEEWFDGKDADPILISLKSASPDVGVSVRRAVSCVSSRITTNSGTSKGNSLSPSDAYRTPTSVDANQLTSLTEEVQRLSALCASLQARVQQLEQTVAAQVVDNSLTINH